MASVGSQQFPVSPRPIWHSRGTAARELSRSPRPTGSRPKKSQSACPRSSQCGCSRPWTRKLCTSGAPRQAPDPGAVRVSLLHQGAAQARRAPQPPAGRRRTERDTSPRESAHTGWGNPMGPGRPVRAAERVASGGGAQTPGWTGAPFASAGRSVVSVVGSRPDHLRPRQSRAVAAQGVKEAPIDRQVACRRCSRGIFMLVRCL